MVVGAAGGKRAAERVEVGDLADVDARSDARRRCASGCASRTTAPRVGRDRRLLRVLARAGRAARGGDACEVDGSLNCHGYGSSVAVTATFGMVAAARALELAPR